MVVPGVGEVSEDRNLAAAVLLPAIRFRSRGAPWPFPGWGRAAALGAVPHQRLPRLCAAGCQVDPNVDGHPFGCCRGVTGRLVYRFSLPVWVGRWGLCWAWPTTGAPDGPGPTYCSAMTGEAG